MVAIDKLIKYSSDNDHHHLVSYTLSYAINSIVGYCKLKKKIIFLFLKTSLPFQGIAKRVADQDELLMHVAISLSDN